MDEVDDVDEARVDPDGQQPVLLESSSIGIETRGSVIDVVENALKFLYRRVHYVDFRPELPDGRDDELCGWIPSYA